MKSIKVFLVLLALHFQSQAQICFSDNPINYGVSTGIPFLNGVATGNFSTDSLPDVAIAYTNNIRIKLRNGNSGFLNGPLLTIGANNVYEMKAADMDNDGFEDIVVLSIYCKLHIFYNNGNGTFADSIYASGSLFGTGKMFVEDMDNDGFKEVMMIAGNSTVFLNDGLRNFTPQSIPMPYTPDAACIGQWNNDVFPDILVTDNGILHPLLGSGSGLFSQSTGVSFPSNILTMTLADMNNDLFTDVISGTAFDLTVHYRDASGSISQTSQIITNTSVSEFLYPDYFLVSDLEQDFFPELIFSSQWNSNVAVINNVNGTLTMRQYACTGGADHLTLEDMNLDGLPDIVTSSSGPDGYFSLMMGVIGSTFDANEYINSGHGLTSDFETLVAGDLNGDGFKDLVTYGYDTVLVYINNGSGGFASPTKFTVGPTGNNNSPILIADFNADGNLDVIVANAMQQFFLFRGQGNGNFLSPVIILAPDYTFFEAMVVGNFNNDTLPDIAYGVSAAIKILLNSGNGTFSQGSTLSATSYIMGLDVGDFNEDGYDDIVCTNNFTAGNLYLNNGSGLFTASSGFVSCINGSLSAVACGDLNHDGHMDVAFTDYDCGFPDRVIIYHGDGTGALTAGGSVSVYESPYHLAITDINLDGYNDIITNSMSGFLTVSLYYPALSNFSSPIYLASGSKSSSFVATDLNNDQKLDLAYANVYSKDIGVTLNSISLIYPYTPNQLVCNGDSVLLYITDTVPGFTWSNGSTNDSIYVSNPGWYYVTAPPSVLGQCFSSSRVFVQTHSVTAPVFSTLNNPDTVCVNQIAALSATPAGGTFSGPGVLNNQFNPASLPAGMSYTVSYMYIDSIGCSSLPVSISIYVDLCTGIAETENEKIKIFPNPAMNKIEINQGQILFYDRLEVFDIFGRVINARVIEDVILNLSLQELVSGTYQFRFTNSSNKFPSFSKKVLILH